VTTPHPPHPIHAPLRDLVALSNRLGTHPANLAIIGEGNTSTWADDESFWVKASGCSLRDATTATFVRLSMPRVLAMLEGPEPSDDQVTHWLARCHADAGSTLRPSTEALLHAVCLQMPGVRTVAHTHPADLNALACSNAFERFASMRLFPDHVVVCGSVPLIVPYDDPGVPLARELSRRLHEFVAQHGVAPREIHLQNHGLIALGASARDAENVTLMAVKAAVILRGTMAFGGPHAMHARDIERIASRADEHYRQRVFSTDPPAEP
jgi:rhamnose utilization protein RhaD (predicted bifunctional aldolase and dehydrogenase)